MGINVRLKFTSLETKWPIGLFHVSKIIVLYCFCYSKFLFFQIEPSVRSRYNQPYVICKFVEYRKCERTLSNVWHCYCYFSDIWTSLVFYVFSVDLHNKTKYKNRCWIETCWGWDLQSISDPWCLIRSSNLVVDSVICCVIDIFHQRAARLAPLSSRRAVSL